MKIIHKEEEKKGWHTRVEKFVNIREWRPEKKKNEKHTFIHGPVVNEEFSFKYKTMLL